MITKLNTASIYVLDKEEALAFYTTKLGLEKGSDVRQGSYRWLTVRELIGKGVLSGLVFDADDVQGLYETLKARGVTDFTQEPAEHFYGTDMSLRDPFGNNIRILQRAGA
jgi:uncharacterized glyoxalase superfamily protein PhnB